MAVKIASILKVIVDELIGAEVKEKPATVTDDGPMPPLDFKWIEIIRQLTPENRLLLYTSAPSKNHLTGPCKHRVVLYFKNDWIQAKLYRCKNRYF